MFIITIKITSISDDSKDKYLTGKIISVSNMVNWLNLNRIYQNKNKKLLNLIKKK